MINFNKNKLINLTLDKYYETFSHTLDTADYVPDNYNKKIHKYIFLNMKKAFKKVDKEDKIFQRKFNKKLKLEEKKKRMEEKQKKKEEKLLNKKEKQHLFKKLKSLFKHKNNTKNNI